MNAESKTERLHEISVLTRQTVVPIGCVLIILLALSGMFFKAGEANDSLIRMANDVHLLRQDVGTIEHWILGRDSAILVPIAKLTTRINQLERVVYKEEQ